jgi:ribosomal-protein-alanine N-acetyltransferase
MTDRRPPAKLLAITAEDAGVLAELHRLGFAEPWNEAAMRHLIAMPGCFGLVTMTDRAEAMVLARIAADEAEILTLITAPDCRRLGRARDLIDAVRVVARQGGARTLYLEVAEDNLAGRAFYDALGFKVLSRRRNYYAGRTDALVLMTLL